MLMKLYMGRASVALFRQKLFHLAMQTSLSSKTARLRPGVNLFVLSPHAGDHKEFWVCDQT